MRQANEAALTSNEVFTPEHFTTAGGFSIFGHNGQKRLRTHTGQERERDRERGGGGGQSGTGAGTVDSADRWPHAACAPKWNSNVECELRSEFE